MIKHKVRKLFKAALTAATAESVCCKLFHGPKCQIPEMSSTRFISPKLYDIIYQYKHT